MTGVATTPLGLVIKTREALGLSWPKLGERHCRVGAQTSGVDTSGIQERSPCVAGFQKSGGACLGIVGTSGDGGDEAGLGSSRDWDQGPCQSEGPLLGWKAVMGTVR